MRIAHLADIHIRKSPTRHGEYRSVFKNLYKSLIKEKVDRIVIVGDLFHDYIDLQGEAVILASEFLNKLTEIAPVIITRGNHDIRKKAANRIDSIEAVVTAMNNDKVTYHNEIGYFDDDEIGVSWAVWKHGDRNNSPWRKRTKTYNRDNIVIDLFHDPVRGSRTATGFELNKNTYIKPKDLKGDYAFLGDIHKLQYLNDEKTIAYPSSLIAQNFGEGDDKFHGYILWEFNPVMGGQIEGKSKDISIKNPYSYKTVIMNKFTDFTDLDFDIDNLTKHLRIRIKWNTLPEKRNKENERHVIEYVKGYCLKEKIDMITHVNDFYEEDTVDDVDEEELDMNNIVQQEVQHEIFRDYLKKIGVEEDTIDEVIKLDDEISDGLEVEDFTNIQWSVVKMDGKHFMSYDDIEIDWRDLDGLFQITGINTAGKTTIMKLMSYILYNKTQETKTQMKYGDSRYVNNRLPVTYCEGSMVIDINGEYYGIKRKTTVERNKAKEIKAAPTILGFYKLDAIDDILDDDINNIDILSDNDRRQTQGVIERAIGSYDNFMRVVMTTSDTLNSILSGEKSKFIDALLYDSGLDIFDLKLKEFKKYADKVKNLPRVSCNIEQSNDFILKRNDDIVRIEKEINEIENTQQPEVNYRILKGEEFIETLTKKLHNIDDDVYNLDIDHVQQEIDIFQEKIDLLDVEEERESMAIGQLTDIFDQHSLDILKAEKDENIRAINAIRIQIKDEEAKIINEQNGISLLNGQILQYKHDGARCKVEIKDLKESKTCPTCGQLMTEEHLEHVNVKIKEIEHRMFKEIAPFIKAKQSCIPELEGRITDMKSYISELERNIEDLNEDGAKILEEIGVQELVRIEVEQHKAIQARLDQIPIEKQNWELKIDILNKNVELYEKSKKQIEENHKIEEGIEKGKTRLNELKFELEVLKDQIYAKNNERGQATQDIQDRKELIEEFKVQEKQDDIMNIYKKCIHRDGIPTQLLIHKAIPKINQELGDLLKEVPFGVWLDPNDLKLKLAYNNRIDAIIDAIAASGKERTFSAIALKFALNQINAKSKPTLFLLDEVMGKLTEDSVEEFVIVLHAIKDKMKKVLVVEHEHEIDPDYILEVTKDENDVSQLKLT